MIVKKNNQIIHTVKHKTNGLAGEVKQAEVSRQQKKSKKRDTGKIVPPLDISLRLSKGEKCS